MRKIYRGSHGESPERWDSYWGDEALVEFPVRETDPIHRLIRAHVPPGAHILEAGCGSGRWLVHLDREGYEVAGLDFATDTVRRVREALPHIEVRQGDIRNMPYADGEFAALLSIGVVEHLPEGPEAALAECVRVLGPRGLLLISVPYVNIARRVQVMAGHNRRRRAGPFYQYAFPRGEFERMVEQAGARIEGRLYYDHLFGLRRDSERFDRLFGQLETAQRDDRSAGRSASGTTPSPFRRVLPLMRGLVEHPALGPLYGHMLMVRARKP